MKYLVVACLLTLVIKSGAQSISATVTTSSVSCNGTCNGSATVAASGGNAPYSYFWSPSGGTAQSASLLCAGNYSVMVTDSDGRTLTVVGAIQQPPPIQINFTTTGQGCNTIGSATVAAYNAVAPYTYSWSNGAGTSSVISSVAAGIYSVTVTDASSCSRVFTLSVPANTVASFLSITGPSTLCGNSSATFAVSGGTAYVWSNNTIASTNTVYFPAQGPQQTASVTVTGTQAATGCTTSLTHTLMVSKPSVAVTGPSTLCLHHPATLTVTGAQSYLWNGTQTGSVLTLPTSSGSTHSVVGTDGLGCTDTAYHAVTGIYSAAFSVGGGTTCSGRSFVITPTLLTQPPGGSLTLQVLSSSSLIVQPFGPLTFTPSFTQQYSVTVHASAGCISTVAVVGISVTPSPTLTAPVPTICAGLQPTITVSGSTSYTVTHLSPAHIYVLGSNTAGCISDTLHIFPVIYPSPTITAPGGSICAGSPFFIATSGAATYSITGNSFSVSPAQTATYAVTGTSSEGCLPSAPTIVTVTVVPVPSVSINSGSICAGETFTFLPSGAGSYSISGGIFTITPAATSSYSLTGSNASCLSSNTAVATVSVIPTPSLKVIPSTPTICANELLVVKAFGASSYSWSGTPLGGTVTLGPFSITTVYTVSGTNVQGCRDSLNFTITVDECAGVMEQPVSELLIVYPNPNTGVFYVRYPEAVTIRIYDTQGRLVAEGRAEAGEEVTLRVLDRGVYYLMARNAHSIISRVLVVE